MTEGQSDILKKEINFWFHTVSQRIEKLPEDQRRDFLFKLKYEKVSFLNNQKSLTDEETELLLELAIRVRRECGHR